MEQEPQLIQAMMQTALWSYWQDFAPSVGLPSWPSTRYEKALYCSWYWRGFNMSSYDFLAEPAPENYVAGLGRGATGFTTRSDLGTARMTVGDALIEEELAKRAQKEAGGGDDDDETQDPDNEHGLLASNLRSYEAEDEEADRQWAMVDEEMARRGKKRREAREKAEREENEKNPSLKKQFADLKRELANVTEDEWNNIPEAGDHTGKNKRARDSTRQRFYAVPDSVMAGAASSGQYETSIDSNQTNNAAQSGTMTNFADIGKARDKVLQVKLDQAAAGSATATAGTATSVDPQGYLTSLQTQIDSNSVNMGDVRRVRELLESVIKTNPNHAPGWIAAARLEELAGKKVAARNVVAKGCTFCPKNEDIWLENVRLNEEADLHNARVIAGNALKHISKSVNLWISAAGLERDIQSKKRVLRKAIDNVPTSLKLWKELINLEEEPKDARLLLSKATELIPSSVELWLALANLEEPKEAQKVLNKARKALPTSHEVWIAATRLQESMGESSERVNLILNRGIKTLAKENAMHRSREEWIADAEKCEREGANLTCDAIIQQTLDWGLDEQRVEDEQISPLKLFMQDAQGCIARSQFMTARAIYRHTLRAFVNETSVWIAAAELERIYGEKEQLYEILEQATEACPKSEELWMELSNQKLQKDGPQEARKVLARAFKQNPNSENIWLTAVKLEIDSGSIDDARKILKSARAEAGTDRVYFKSAAFERRFGEPMDAVHVCNTGLGRYSKCAKLYMIKGQVYEHTVQPPNIDAAREAYSAGVRHCPKSVPLWIMLSNLEERAGIVIKARSVLERARLANPKNPLLWVESVRLERRVGNASAATSLMSRAMQEVPVHDSGILWEEKIWHLDARNQRKSQALEASKKVDNDPIIFIIIARIFWAERQLEKAIKWFEKGAVLDPDYGDTWAWYAKFLSQHGTDEKREEVVTKCVLSDPKHGQVWPAVRKDPKNADKSTEEILKLTMAALDDQ